ncbi:MAG: class I SAM-dependent methyltransferase [Pseudorhodoplanes sp.]
MIAGIKKLVRALRQLRHPGVALCRLETFEQHSDLIEMFIGNPKLMSEATRLKPYVEAILEAVHEQRTKILSIDQGQYVVGTKNSATRDAWVEQMLKALPAGGRLLDAGAGECQYKKHCGHLQYVAQDVAIYDGKGDVGLQTGTWDLSQIDIVCDITTIPEPDGSFDAVLCTEVLEHLADPVAALGEMARLLKGGGSFIITAPFWSLTHFAPYHYATGFNRYFYEHHLERLGFDITDLVPNGNFFECIGQEVRRIQDMAQRFCVDAPTLLERYAMQIVLAMAQRMSTADRGSAEMLHYGYQVRAVKAGPGDREGIGAVRAPAQN